MALTDMLIKEVKKQTKSKKHKSHSKSTVTHEVEKIAKKELKKRLKF